MDIRSLIDKAGVTPSSNWEELTRQVIAHTRLDHEIYQSGPRTDPDINDGIHDLLRDQPPEHVGYINAPELVEDLFHALHKVSPRFVDIDQVYEDALVSHP